MKLSKSKINSYLKCPLEFKFQYIDEIETPPNKYMALGSDVHLIAETFTDKFQDELENVNIKNELLKIANDLEIGYDLSNHIDNLSLFFKDVFIDNDYKVIDYKTGNSNSFSKYRLELCYYKLLVENVYEKNVSSVGVFFTKNGRLRLLDICDIDNKRKYLHSSEINEAIETMHHVRKEINNGNFPARKQFLCKYCTYKHLCGEY